MKKINKFIFCLLTLFILAVNVNAICDNEDLNEWATTVEVKMVHTIGDVKYEVTKADGTKEEVTKEFAYILTINNPRDDILLKFKDEAGNTADGVVYTLADGTKVYGAGCFTNLEEEKYIVNVYGKDTCNNELLKTIQYTVPRFNEYVYNAACLNSDSEYCKNFTNSTKDMTYEDFKKAMAEEEKKNNRASGIWGILKEYGLYVLIPLIIVSVYYITKIRKYKQEERDR